MRLIIDTDAGVDDAQAILMALAHPGVTVEAITAVTGNTHVDWVIRNVFTVLSLKGASVPVYRGAASPLVPGFWQPEVRVHGEDGLGNYRQRPDSYPDVEPEPAAMALVRLAHAAPGELTLVALGPLTNVALACRLDPDFPRKLKHFIFMGGTIAAKGNTAPHITAEFNIHCDPEAALIALDAFPQATMLSWEATLYHPFSWSQYDALVAQDSAAARFVAETTRETVTFLRQHPRVPGYLLPDPLAMAVALDPTLIQSSERHYVTVEVQGRHTRGQTVVDYFALLEHEPNVDVVTGVDVMGVFELFRRALA
ncbi:MAG: nucleoside hydrolase [Aggregatilineaceae bacterium]